MTLFLSFLSVMHDVRWRGFENDWAEGERSNGGVQRSSGMGQGMGLHDGGGGRDLKKKWGEWFKRVDLGF